MMGRQTGDQSQLFYLFNLERRIPAGNLLRRINPVVSRILVELRDKLAAFYSDIGRPSIDPELMIRMLIIGYCYGIRSERRLCEEVASPCVPLVLSSRSRRSSARSLDILGQSPWSLP
jgi:transposase